MKRRRWRTGLWAALMIMMLAVLAVGCSGDASDGEVAADPVNQLSEEAKACVERHATETPGVVADWDNSVHAQEAVSCVDCHEVPADSPLAIPDIECDEWTGTVPQASGNPATTGHRRVQPAT